jgi:hypothetical protein
LSESGRLEISQERENLMGTGEYPRKFSTGVVFEE